MTNPDAPQPPRDDDASEATSSTTPSDGPPPQDKHPPADATSTPHNAPQPQDEPASDHTTSTPHDAPPPQDPPPPHDPPSGGPGAARPPPYRTRTLDRRSTNRVVAGVAGGLGDYFNVDPAIFRLGFIVLAAFGGSGFLLYLVGWLFLPERGTQRSVGEGLVRRLGGGRSAGGLILLFVALLVVADTIGGGGLIWAALLIGIGVLLFRQADESDDDDPPSSGPGDRSTTSMWSQAPQAPAPAAPSSASGGVVTAPPSTNVQSSVTSPAADPPLPPPPPTADDGWRPTPYTPGELPTPPSVLGRVTVAAALILIGATALLDTLTGVDVAVASYAALALTVIGAGLLVGARWGGARGLIALGGVTVLVLTMSSVTAQLPSGGIEGGVGQRTYRPETVAQLQDPYRLGFGEMQIDLTALELQPGQDIAVDASMSVGSLQVIVPDDVSVEAEATARLGAVDLLDRTSDGTDASTSVSEPGEEGSPTITLDLSTVMGEVEVHRASTGPDIKQEPSAEVN
ncbi:MAG TPA: PspC domain-containing protein [Euzebyales bacterium]|nr:PspC domain-containing protein [Euzebyales bacterium]